MFKNTFLLILTFFLFVLDITNAQTSVDSLKNLLNKTTGNEKIKILVKIGYYLSSENPNEAINYLDKAIVLADQNGDRWSKADALFDKGVALWHLGKIDESGEYYDEAKIIYEDYKDTLSLTKVLNSEAINHSMKNEPDLALKKFFKSLEYAKRLGDRLTIFNTLFNIGIVFDNQGELDKALNHYLLAIDYTDDQGSLALIQNYIAEIYITQKNYSEAEFYLNKAVKNAHSSKDNNSLVWAYTNLGNLTYIKNHLSNAEKYFLNALAIARQTDYKLDIIHTLFELGKFYNNTKNYIRAENNLLEAYQIADSIKSLQDLSNISETIASVYSNLGNYKQAFEYLKLNKQFSDSLFVITNDEKVTELETKYALNQKEKEADILKKENVLQKNIIETRSLIAIIVSILGILLLILVWLLVRNRQRMLVAQQSLIQKNKEIETNRKEINEKNQALETLNTTKDKFFSIIAHDLRNPIAAFVSISEILESDFDRLDNNEKKALLTQMNNSSKNLIRLLENLLTWARLSNNKLDVVKQKVNCREIIESAVYPYEHWAKNKKIDLMLNVRDDLNLETDPFIFQTIVGNLINNAIKFSNHEGVVNITHISDNGKQKIIIKDQGIGIEEKRLKTLFDFNVKNTTRGTQNETGTGLGLVLVKDLIDKMEWNIEVKSVVNEGSEFIITILN
jgi:signal transduction histidine kinase